MLVGTNAHDGCSPLGLGLALQGLRAGVTAVEQALRHRERRGLINRGPQDLVSCLRPPWLLVEAAVLQGRSSSLAVGAQEARALLEQVAPGRLALPPQLLGLLASVSL